MTLKGLCSTNGLSNTAGEEIVVTSVFLYKFLNDKFIAIIYRAFAKDIGMFLTMRLIKDKERLYGRFLRFLSSRCGLRLRRHDRLLGSAASKR